VDNSRVRLFFEDEASFGRISEPKYCWCGKGIRPIVPQMRVREYREVFGAVEPETGDFFCHIEDKTGQRKNKSGKLRKPRKGAKSRQMNAFMQNIADIYPKDQIVLVCDNAWWHKSKYTKVPDRITVVYIPPYTPEMNPIEQVWREIRTRMGNHIFQSIEEVLSNLKETISRISRNVMRSITQRDWIAKTIKSGTG